MDQQENGYQIPFKILLSTPIKWGANDERTEISVQRKLKAKDFKGIPVQNMQFDHMLKLVSKITNEPLAFIEELEIEDLMKAIEVLNSFLPGGLGTGISL